MGASTSDPGKRKFTDRDVLRCFNEENRRSVGKIELSSKEITEILNQSVLDGEGVTRQAVKNRLDEMAGDELARNQHGRSHLYSRSDDLDRLFREPEPATTGPAPGGSGGRPPRQEGEKGDNEHQFGQLLPNSELGTVLYVISGFAIALIGVGLAIEAYNSFKDSNIKRTVHLMLTFSFSAALVGFMAQFLLLWYTSASGPVIGIFAYGIAVAAYIGMVLANGGFLGLPAQTSKRIIRGVEGATA